MRPEQELTQNLFHHMTVDSFSTGESPKPLWDWPCSEQCHEDSQVTCRNTHLQKCRPQWKSFNPCWGCLVMANPSKRTLWHRVELHGQWHYENSPLFFPLLIFWFKYWSEQLSFLSWHISSWQCFCQQEDDRAHEPPTIQMDIIPKMFQAKLTVFLPCESSWMAAVINPEACWLIQ